MFKMKKKSLALLLMFCLVALSVFVCAEGAFAKDKNHLTIATTTSVNDTGLLGKLVPIFEKRYKAKVDVISVGTGQALELGRRGDADLVLVHSKKQEEKFINEGYGEKRVILMCNYFVIVGPKNNPAGIGKYTQVDDAFKKIAATKSNFISRGDKSGTHTKELSLWEEAGIQPKGKWYIQSGTGQSASLMMANEKKAYMLTDKASYLALEAKDKVPNLGIVVDGGKSLLNVYSAIAVSPAKNPNTNYALAQKFISFMNDVNTQVVIKNFGKAEYGKPLFTPKISMTKAQFQ